MRIKRIGLVGCGVIGTKIAQAIAGEFSHVARLCALYDIDSTKVDSLSGKLKKINLAAGGLEDLIKKSDFVIEAASSNVSADIARKALNKNRDCLIMSVGGLLGAIDIFELARKKGCSLHIPSGAICGIDGLKAHALVNIKRVTLTTTKPPQALEGSPYVIKNKIDLSAISKATEIFSGSAKDAVTCFPQNINVAAVLSLAGIGSDKTRVRMVCSPGAQNIHEIEIESEAGRTFVRCENEPSPDNPKTSYLAILSAIAALKRIFEPVKIGT